MFKKFRNLLFYRKTLLNNKDLLLKNHGISIDWVWRMYKTYTILPTETERVKNLGIPYVEELIRTEASKISQTFLELDILEMVDFREAIQLNDKQIGMSFQYKFINTARMVRRIIMTTLFLLLGGLGFIFFSYLGLLIGLSIWFIIYVIRLIAF